MASIVQRGKSFSVVYTTVIDGVRKQKWETYHSHSAAQQRKSQLDLVQQQQKWKASYPTGTLAHFLDEYVQLYGRINWSCCTGTGYLRNTG